MKRREGQDQRKIQQLGSLQSEISFKDPKGVPPPFEIQRYRFSPDFAVAMKRMIIYQRKNFIELAIGQFKRIVQEEAKRLREIKVKDRGGSGQIDNELSVIVMGNQIKALIELKGEKEVQSGRASFQSNSIEKQSRIVRRFQGIVSEIEKVDQEILQFMDSSLLGQVEIDYSACYSFFSALFKKIKHPQDKILLSRANLIKILTYFLRDILRRLDIPFQKVDYQNDVTQQSIIRRDSNAISSQFSQEQKQFENDPLDYRQVNKWSRYSSVHIQDKVLQLSGICEQIPQLQTFNRTLQFSQLESRQKITFFKIVDVLISLHHKVSYLSRRKPQILRQLELVKQQIIFINESIEIFLRQIDQEQPEIFAINFSGWNDHKRSQLTVSFSQLKGSLLKMSEIIISQDMFHTQNFDKIDRLLKIVTIFCRMLGNQEEAIQQWENKIQEMVNGGILSKEQYSLLEILQECLERIRSRGSEKTNAELQQQVTKLIQDYERLKQQNNNLIERLNVLGRERQDYSLQIEQRDIMIGNLSAIKISLEKKIAQLQRAQGSREQLKSREDSRLFQSERQKLIRQFEQQKQKGNTLRKERERLSKQLQLLGQRLEAQRDESQRGIDNLNKKLKQSQTQKKRLKEQLENSQNENIKIVEKYEKRSIKDDKSQDRGRQIDRLKREIQDLKLSKAQLQEERVSFLQQNSKLKYSLKEMKDKLEQHDEKDALIATLKSKNEKISARLDALNQENQALSQRQDESSRKAKNALKKLGEFQTRVLQLQTQNSGLQKRLQQQKRRIDQLNTLLTNLRDRHNKEIKEYQQNLFKRDSQLSVISNENERLRLKITSLENEISLKIKQFQNIQIRNRFNHDNGLEKPEQLSEDANLIRSLQSERDQLLLQLNNQKKYINSLLDQKNRLVRDLNDHNSKVDDLIQHLHEIDHQSIKPSTENESTDSPLQKQNHHEIQENIQQVNKTSILKDQLSKLDDLTLQNSKLFNQNNQLVNSLKEERNKIQQFKKKIGELRTQNDLLTKRVKQLQRLLNEQQKRFGLQIQKQRLVIEKLNQQLSVAFQSSKIDKFRINQLQEQKLLNLNSQIQRGRVQKNNLLQANQRLKQDLQEKQKQIRKLEQKLNSDLTNLLNQKHQIQEKLSECQNYLRNESGRVNEMVGYINYLESQLNGLVAEKKRIQEDLKRITDELARIKGQNQSRRLQNQKLFSQNQKLKSQNMTKANHILDLQGKFRHLQQQKGGYLNIIQKITRQKEVLAEQNEKKLTQPQLKLLQKQNMLLFGEKERLLNEKETLLKKLSALTLDLQSSTKQKDSLAKSYEELSKKKTDQQSLLINQEKQIYLLKQQNRKALAQPSVSQIEERLKISLERQYLGKEQTLKDKLQQLQKRYNEAIKQRDLMRLQYGSLRSHLEEQSRRAIYLEAQLLKIQDEGKGFTQREKELLKNIELANQQLEQQRKKSDSFSLTIYQQSQLLTKLQNQSKQFKLNFSAFYLEKIRALEEALSAVTDELRDAKGVKSKTRETFGCNEGFGCFSLAESRFASEKNQTNQIRRPPSSISDAKRSRERGSSPEREATNFSPRMSRLYSENIKLKEENTQLHQLVQRNLLARPTPSFSSSINESRYVSYSKQQQMEEQIREFSQKQTEFLAEIQWLNRQVIRWRQSACGAERDIKSLPSPTSINPRYDQKYVLRIEGQHMKKGIEALKNTTLSLNEKLDQILQASRKSINIVQMFESLKGYNIPHQTSIQLEKIVENNKILVESVRSLREENKQLSTYISQLVNTQNLMQYVFRVLIYFSQISDNSPGASSIRKQLQVIKNSYQGGLLFSVLEQYTIQILESNAIEQYKRQLRNKARQLLDIKERLQEVIARQIEEEEKIIKKSNSRGELLGQHLSRSRQTGYYGKLAHKSNLGSIFSTPHTEKQ